MNTPRLKPLKPRLKSSEAIQTENEPLSAPNAPMAVLARLSASVFGARTDGASGGPEPAPKDGAASRPSWFETFPPYGRYPVGGIVPGSAQNACFVFDEASAKEIVERFRKDAEREDWPGVLVDREHFSVERDKPSDAMAWAKDIRVDDDGSIWTRWEFTAPGRELWDGKVLVSRSPYFECVQDGDDFRPIRLISIGMTNTPHFTELSTLAAARAAEVTNNKGEIHMNKIIEALGLGEGATEEDVLAAIDALKQQASDAVAKAEEADKKAEESVAECRALKAEAFVAAHADRIADAAAAKAAYVKDPAIAEQMLAACKTAEAAKPQQVLAPAKANPAKAEDVRVQLAKCRSPQEMLDFAISHSRELAEASNN
jgi:hypothetical protein